MSSKGASLDRYYLFKLFGYGVFLHHIHHSDPEDLYHTHPWDFISIIFGSYAECRIAGIHWWATRRFLNFVKATTPHRVVIKKPVWTLVFHGRKYNKWRITDHFGDTVKEKPWEGSEGFKDYVKA